MHFLNALSFSVKVSMLDLTSSHMAVKKKNV